MARPRTRRRDDRVERKPKKRVSILDSEQITYVDYKDVNLLRRFMSERAKIRARRVTGLRLDVSVDRLAEGVVGP